jgi:antibiotic biosynthesis monooxygenase (ABM) superfamily enzyme
MTYSRPRGAVTIITQTRVHEGGTDAFAKFQAAISAVASEQPGFIEQSVLPPNPPAQVDWVILQRFTGRDEAIAWLRSDQRHALLAEVQPILSGLDDVHLVRDAASGALPSPVSAVISTRVRPGHEAEYRAWEQRIATAQARFPGFQGYRFEPPIPGVQESSVAILRFESEATLQAWMDSPERRRLLADAEGLTEGVDARVVRSGFSQWFPAEAQKAPAWKGNMLVLLLLYPIVFLFGLWVGTPLLERALGLPFWLALFLGNVTSVWILSYAVPVASKQFTWWLNRGPEHGLRLGKILWIDGYGLRERPGLADLARERRRDAPVDRE